MIFAAMSFLSPEVIILTSSNLLESSQENEHFSLKIKYKVREGVVQKYMEGLRCKCCRIWRCSKKGDECRYL